MRYFAVISAMIFLTVPFSSGFARQDKEKPAAPGADERFFDMTHAALENVKTLELTEKQYKFIKDLKRKTERNNVQKNAKIDLLKIEINNALYEDSFDTDQVEKYIVQKYELKKALGIANLKALSDLKASFTAQQRDKLKDSRVSGKAGPGEPFGFEPHVGFSP